MSTMTDVVPPDSNVANVVLLDGDQTCCSRKGGVKEASLWVAVPLYIIFWELPKWVITQAFPAVAQVALRRVIVPFFEWVERCLESVLSRMVGVVRAVCARIFIPIRVVAKWLWSVVLGPALCHLVRIVRYVVSRSMNCIREYFFEPLTRALISCVHWVRVHIVDPSLVFLLRCERVVSIFFKKIFNTFLEFVAPYLVLVRQCAMKCMQVVLDRVFRPLFYLVLGGVKSAYRAWGRPCIRWVGGIGCEVSQRIRTFHRSVIQPSVAYIREYTGTLALRVSEVFRPQNQ